jgi:Rha family phage regulatory protein
MDRILELLSGEKSGKFVATSLEVAEMFDKEHKNVLRHIRDLSCSQEFRHRNFAESSYMSAQNKQMPMYEITKDGFIFLVLGFNGNKVSRLKEMIIESSNI